MSRYLVRLKAAVCVFWQHSIWSLASPFFSSCRAPFTHADIRATQPSTAHPWSPRHLFISARARGAGRSRHNLCLPVTAWVPDHRAPPDLGSRPRPHESHTPGGPGSAQCWRWRWEKHLRLELLWAGIRCNYLFLYLQTLNHATARVLLWTPCWLVCCRCSLSPQRSSSSRSSSDSASALTTQSSTGCRIYPWSDDNNQTILIRCEFQTFKVDIILIVFSHICRMIWWRTRRSPDTPTETNILSGKAKEDQSGIGKRLPVNPPAVDFFGC